MKVALKNNAKCGIIIPGVGELGDLKGMIVPGEILEVESEFTKNDFVRNLLETGELSYMSAVPVDIDEEPADEMAGVDIDTLRKQCDLLGIDYTPRWGAAKLQQAIDAASN